MMNNITFDCETITPMFLNVADGETTEIRAASLKGVLRFWWRAVNCDLPLDELRKDESELFGGSGEGQGRSKLVIRVVQSIEQTIRYSPVPHKDTVRAEAFKPGQVFKIKISAPEKYLDTFKNIFILISALGGIGKRSRRGFGSFRIIKTDNENYNMPSGINEIYNLLESIKQGKFQIKENKIVLKGKAMENYPYIKEIQIGNGNPDMDELLKVIGNASHDFNGSGTSGFARGNERLASPLYITTLKKGTEYFPVITTLNSVFKDKMDMNIVISDQGKFKGALL